MKREAERQEIKAGFDSSAATYDREAAVNASMRYMRTVSLEMLHDVFQRDARVLEVGCGTGQEAVALARQGVEVVATDISSQMASVTRAKIAALGLEERVVVRQLAASALGTLVAEYGEGAFHGAYSSFGALNGEPSLEKVGEALSELLEPGARLVVSVMNRFCLFEVLWYLGHAAPGRAFRRWGGSAMAAVSPDLPDRVPTWYYTPRSFERAMGDGFRRVHCLALPLFLPPPFAAHLWQRAPRLIRLLRRWDTLLAYGWPWYTLGDHFLMILERV